jgi:carbonic anhydrase
MAKDVAKTALPHADKKALLDYTEKVSVIFQLENLLSYPAVKRGVEEGKLFMHGWHYDIASGNILYYDEEELVFSELGSGL